MLRKFMGMSSITSVRRSVKRMVLAQGTEVKKSRLGFAKLLRRPGAIGSEGLLSTASAPLGLGVGRWLDVFHQCSPRNCKAQQGLAEVKGLWGWGPGAECVGVRTGGESGRALLDLRI